MAQVAACKQAQHTLEMAMRWVSRCMIEHGFSLTLEKTTVPPIQVGEIVPLSQPAALSKLFSMISKKVSFLEQI